MSIPTRTEATAILRGLAPSQKLLNHSAAVAEVAAFVCAAIAARGVAIDAAIVEAAALLHDVDKALPAGDPHRALGHGTGGAAWLRSQGYPEVADAMERHPVMALAETDGYEAWAARTSLEARVVSYADKRALQGLVSLDERFAYWYERYPDSPMLPLTHQRARELERDVCATAGVAPEEIERLAWVDDALGGAA